MPSSMSITSSSTIYPKRKRHDLWLPLTPAPALDIEVVMGPEEDEPDIQLVPRSTVSSPGILSLTPKTTVFTPTSAFDIDQRLSEMTMLELKSVFEDWDDPVIPNSSVVVDEDGTQTVLIPHESHFYFPPTPPAPFDYKPFSNYYPDNDIDIVVSNADNSDDDEDSSSAEPSPDAITTPRTSELAVGPTKNKTNLFVDTAHPSIHNPSSDFALSGSLFYSTDTRAKDEAVATDHSFVMPIWAAGQYTPYDGPDVPLDCIYSAGDVSPIDHWGEKLWSPITLLNPIRSAPCT